MVGIDTVIYFTVTDPRAATYEVANPLQAIEQLTVTTLRNVIGGMTLEETLTSRDSVNNQLRAVLDDATGRWGIRVDRVELKSVEPPRTVQEAMEKQMRAERDRRATILTAEGVKQSADPHRGGREAVRRAPGRGPADRGDPQGRGRGEGDRDGLRRDPRRRARPGAALLPVPADAARSSPAARRTRSSSSRRSSPRPSAASPRASRTASPRRAKPKPRDAQHGRDRRSCRRRRGGSRPSRRRGRRAGRERPQPGRRTARDPAAPARTRLIRRAEARHAPHRRSRRRATGPETAAAQEPKLAIALIRLSASSAATL